jgi:galactokinase
MSSTSSTLPVIATAPGRVNLIGEHTDYNGGYVLPMAIPQRTRVELTRRTDQTVTAWSASHSHDQPPLAYELGHERRGGTWLDYVQGVTLAAREAGFQFGGFNLRISSEVPTGSGLSSSAALEVAMLRALREALGQTAENELVGARVGIMDQMASSLADETTALFLDTLTLEYRRIRLPPGIGLLVIHSGVTHQHASGEYNQRRAECEAACGMLGVQLLRECTSDDLPQIAALPDPLARRARHVVTENERVLEAVAAMEHHDPVTLGQLFNASHASMRDDYEVSAPDVDTLVALAQEDPEVFGARMTGGGFGGAIVALTHAAVAPAAGHRITRKYQVRTSRQPAILVPSSAE